MILAEIICRDKAGWDSEKRLLKTQYGLQLISR
jgi:hypothetical protein